MAKGINWQLITRVFAEEKEGTKFTPLSTGLEDLGFDQSSLQDFGAFLTQLYQSVIAIAVVASIVVIIWGGFIYMTTDAIGKKQEGKEKIKNAIFGLLIALSSYLIFNLIDPNIKEIDLGKNLTAVNLQYKYDEGIGERGEVGDNYSDGTYTSPVDGGESEAFSGSEQDVRNALATGGVGVKQSNTTVQGLRQSTIDNSISLREMLGENYVITGGTEHGHYTGNTYSHRNGYKIDIGSGSNSSNWAEIDRKIGALNGGTTAIGTRFNHTMPTGDTATFYKEGDGESEHWDIRFTPKKK